MAQDINSVIVVGNLTKDLGSDPNGRDFGYTQGGMCIANFSIANNRNRKQADGTWGSETSYFDIKLFGKTAENLKPYLTKGKKIVVNGVLKQERWQDKNGNNQFKVVIYATEIELVGGKKDDNSQQSSFAQQYEQQTQNPFSKTQQSVNQNPFVQQNGMAQVQQMAGQSMQPRQAQPIQPHNDGFQEDLNFGGESEIPF